MNSQGSFTYYLLSINSNYLDKYINKIKCANYKVFIYKLKNFQRPIFIKKYNKNEDVLTLFNFYNDN